jgi:hypothetical protein
VLFQDVLARQTEHVSQLMHHVGRTAIRLPLERSYFYRQGLLSNALRMMYLSVNNTALKFSES